MPQQGGSAPRRPARPRGEVLAATMAAIAEHGLAGLTMAALGRRLGMSGGHLLYYFGSKDQLLLETLRWSEAQLGERRGALLARHAASAGERLADFIDLYLPTGQGDPRWTLWIEVWSRSLALGEGNGGSELREGQREIAEVWHRDLVALLAEGARTGGFTPPPGTDLDRLATRLEALLDGLAIPLVTGLPTASRADALSHAHEHAVTELGINSVPPSFS
jgi:AcrR family transcriptional regulator